MPPVRRNAVCDMIICLPEIAPPDKKLGTQNLALCLRRYDLPPDYNTRILQYIRAINSFYCSWRGFDGSNNAYQTTSQHYFLETYLHEQFLISPHRCKCR